MRVIISGATGLIGKALTSALVARGDEVVSLVRPGGHSASGPTVSWDPSERSVNMAALDDLGAVDAIVHLAGAGIADKRWTPGRKAEIRRSRTDGTATLAGAAAEMTTKPSVFVCGSAIGWYGSRGDEVLDESSSAGEGFLAELCVEWEQAAQPAVDADIRTAYARTGIVLAREGGALAKQLPLFRAGVGGRLGPGTQWTSWISIEDEIRGLLAIIDDEELAGPVDLTAPEPVRNAEFTKSLGRALHRPTLLPVPPFALKAALGAELVDEALLASQRVLPSALSARGFTFSHPTIDEAFDAILA
jgi:uncharacterized protein (TIGR01777 family)